MVACTLKVLAIEDDEDTRANLCDILELSLRIRDNGPGLAPDHRRFIFQPFFTTKREGTGLGMAISKRIIEAHGGQIELVTNSHPGAEFAITLPRTL